MPVDAVDERLRQVELVASSTAEKISSINRSLDKISGYGESIVQIREQIVGLREAIKECQDEVKDERVLASQREDKRLAEGEQRRLDRQADFRWKVTQLVFIVCALIAAVTGIYTAGV